MQHLAALPKLVLPHGWSHASHTGQHGGCPVWEAWNVETSLLHERRKPCFLLARTRSGWTCTAY